MNFFSEAKSLISENIRDYGMYIALFVIILTFSIMTDGLFMSSRNISNLLDSTGYIAVLAVGMTLVIVIRHIDLSVGFLAGFLGAIVAILLTQMGVPIFVAIPIILILVTTSSSLHANKNNRQDKNKVYCMILIVTLSFLGVPLINLKRH